MTMQPYKKLTRLYVPDAVFGAGNEHVLPEGQLHYLRNVMRAGKGDRLRIFNGRDGAWLAEIKEINKKSVVVSFIEKTEEQSFSPDITILASPVKKENFDFMVEKACELGAAIFQPVICDHTVVHRVNEERLKAISIEAAEQCERTDIMQVQSLSGLRDILKGWDNSRKLVFCLERAAAKPIIEAKVSMPLGLLIGPEGGFSNDEIAYISQLDFVLPVSLGSRILRAETALVAALACLQSQTGDWSGSL